MPKRKPTPDEAKQQAVEEITILVDAFCQEHLNVEYAVLCRRLTEKLACKWPRLLISGKGAIVDRDSLIRVASDARASLNQFCQGLIIRDAELNGTD